MSKFICLATLMVVLMVSTPLVQAQDEVDPVPECVTELESCGPYVNSTTIAPPAECCQPLQMVIENEITCLCSIFSSIEVIQALNLNVTEALTLPQRCGIQFDIYSQCQALAPSQAPSMTPATAPISGMD